MIYWTDILIYLTIISGKNNNLPERQNDLSERYKNFNSNYSNLPVKQMIY